jgi:hypothetical protein
MDSTAVPWIMLASVGVAAISAIAAAVSACFSWRASRTAACFAATTLILKYRDQYGTNAMLIDLHNLDAWHDKHGPSKFAETWRKKRGQNDKEALTVDASRRRVSHFFSSIVDLHDAGLVPKRIKKLLIDFDGLDVYYSVVEPLERELNPGYNKTPFQTLRKLRPPRVGLTRYAPINWVIRDP